MLLRIYRIIQRGQKNSRVQFSDGSTGLVPNRHALVGYYWDKKKKGRQKGKFGSYKKRNQDEKEKSEN